MNDIENRLRATLAEQAKQAPPGAALAERILAEVDSPARVLRPRHGWRTWTMPLLAAAAVAAIVATVVGIQNDRHTAAPVAPAVSHGVTASPTVDSSPTPAPTPTSMPAPATVPADPNSIGLDHFQAIDITFVGSKDGWALGNSDCLNDSAKTCAAMVFTTDGGTSWHSMKQPPGDVAATGCGALCFERIRFATDRIGYAFGPTSFAMTKDGGATWQRESGGAEALETLDGNVIRLVAKSSSGCPGPCDVSVETAMIGSSTWSTQQLAPGGISPIAVQLARSGTDAYVLATRNPASGAGIQTSTLYVSTDDGASWLQRPEPCPQAGFEVDSTALAAGTNGTVIVLCTARPGSSPDFVAVSHDHGSTFARAAGSVPTSVDLVAGDTKTVLVAAGAVARRSTNGGASWARIDDLAGTVSFLGFESKTVGRAVTDGGRTIWTTHDAGRTWHAFDFS